LPSTNLADHHATTLPQLVEHFKVRSLSSLSVVPLCLPSTNPLSEHFQSTVCVRVSCGAEHTAAITDVGDLYTWGCAELLGHGDGKDRGLPWKLEISKKGKRVVEVSCGCEHSAALLETGAMYTWGHGAGGRLGISERDGSVVDGGDVAMPRRVTAMKGLRVVQVTSYI
jgi:alpha-tubulin suppressor-like RCC1 family protein